MAKSAEEVSSEFYCAIGRAITAWNLVEDGLQDIFSRIVFCSIAGTVDPAHIAHPKAHWVVGGIFYGSTNLRGRLKMIDEMIELVVSDDALLKRWNSLQNKVLKKYKRRATLAHSHAWGNETEGVTALRPTLFDRDAQAMNLTEVLDAERSFRGTSDQLTEFAIAVNKYMVEAYPPKGIT